MKKASKKQRAASVAELKARLSEHLRIVKAGGEVTVTERGRPIARLVPITGGLATSARVESLIVEGLARAPLRKLTSAVLRVPRPADRAGRSLDIVLEERADDR